MYQLIDMSHLVRYVSISRCLIRVDVSIDRYVSFGYDKEQRKKTDTRCITKWKQKHFVDNFFNSKTQKAYYMYTTYEKLMVQKLCHF